MGNSLGMNYWASKMPRWKVTPRQLMSCHGLWGKGARQGQMWPAVLGNLELRLRLLKPLRQISWQARPPRSTPCLLVKR